jgi:hypothetical protein
MSNYEIGYGKPPKSGQFRKGRSGNPTGRPKGVKNLAMAAHNVVHRRVRLQSGDGHQYLEIGEATLLQQGNKAAMGDLKAAKFLLDFYQMSGAAAIVERQIARRIIVEFVDASDGKPAFPAQTKYLGWDVKEDKEDS